MHSNTIHKRFAAAHRTGHVFATTPIRPRLIVRAVSEPFNEGAAQVKRLISRDRKEFLGNSEDILDKYTTEFGDAASNTSVAPAAPQRSVGVQASDNPFGKAPANPFGSSSAPQPFKNPKSSIEPAGLRPDMGPDPIIKEKAFNLFESITLTQIFIACSFTLIIGLMIGTFYFVLNAGGIRLNGI